MNHMGWAADVAWQDWAAGSLVLAASLHIGWRAWRALTAGPAAGSGCGGGCAQCPSDRAAAPEASPPRVVTIDPLPPRDSRSAVRV